MLSCLCGLGFILFQKGKNCRLSILQASSTSLKHAQVRWAIPELELLAVKYMLNKCHFYMAWATKTIIVYSNCEGLKHYQTHNISDIDNHRHFMIIFSEIGQKDEDYKTMIQFIKANKSFQDLPTSSEGTNGGRMAKTGDIR